MGKASLAAIRCLRAAGENRDQFAAFSDGRWNLPAFPQRLPGNDPQPDHRLAQLLERDLHLVDKVFPRFRAARFRIVRRRGCARAQQLATDMIAALVFGKASATSITMTANPISRSSSC